MKRKFQFMNIKTAYGSVSPTGDTESKFRDKLSLANRVSNLLSIRNSNFEKFVTDLDIFLKNYESNIN